MRKKWIAAITAMLVLSVLACSFSVDLGLQGKGGAASPTPAVQTPVAAATARTTPAVRSDRDIWADCWRPIVSEMMAVAREAGSGVVQMMHGTEESGGQADILAFCSRVPDWADQLERLERRAENCPDSRDQQLDRAGLLLSAAMRKEREFVGVQLVGFCDQGHTLGWLIAGTANMDDYLELLYEAKEELPQDLTGFSLPTAPSPTPAPTPLPAGSSIRIEDWEIQVERIEIAHALTSSVTGHVEGAAGRFAVLFLAVTNRGLSTDSFGSIGTIEIGDAEGQRYMPNGVAELHAEDQYGIDSSGCLGLNPGATGRCVAVFDISEKSSSYVLAGAHRVGASLLLDIP